jgi:chemotaxis protein MotB
MKDKPSEWVSISDLMAGVLAIVMLLLVISALQKTVMDIQHKADMERAKQAEEHAKQEKRNVVADILSELEQQSVASSSGTLISIDVSAGKITLKDSVFARGSACITETGSHSTKAFQEKIHDFLSKIEDGNVYIEGHTDSIPVLRPVTDFARFCTVYDDNFTLSAARAREIRKRIIAGLDASIARRILVAGYGDSQPLPDIPLDDARNRRVEIHFLAGNQRQ